MTMNESQKVKIKARNVTVHYGEARALHGIDLDLNANEVTALIGPSGCGKSTFLRCINRMNDVIDGCRVGGTVSIDEQNIYSDAVDVVELRARVGMVFQKPNPFPKSIYDNVAYGPRIHGMAPSRSELDHIVETSLKRAGLWDEVKDRFKRFRHQPVRRSAAALMHCPCHCRHPDIVLMDEPCSALDPIATAVIEELMEELRRDYTIVIVTHSMQQAARISQRTAYFHLGDLVEHGQTQAIFTNPENKQTEAYISGKIG